MRLNIEHLSDISKEKKNSPVVTNFADRVKETTQYGSKDMIDSISIKTTIQKEFDKYIENLYLIQKLKKTKLITNTDIQNIKHHLFDIDKIIEDKLNDSDDIKEFVRNIINSSYKQVANNIFDNFINNTIYSQKQIELINNIKNIIFGSSYMDIHTSVINVNELLYSELHPISNEFDNLSENEQDDIIDVIELLEE